MIGSTVAHYRILDKLGGGGMGVVYRAEDTRLRRSVALKFLPPELTRDDTARARFTQEAQAASALDHPNICTIHEIGETPDGQTFIVMALYEGETLKKKIERGPLAVDDALNCACQIAEGLARAHSRGIVHRDIKPANLLVTNDGLVKILDFGLAKSSEETGLTQAGFVLGTTHYMSPEQARGERVDTRTDLWSLGVVLYEMFTGERPFRGDSSMAVLYAIIHDTPPPLSGSRPGLPGEISRMVKRALAHQPSSRYASADELLQDLRAVRRQQDTGVRPVEAKRIPAIAVLPFSDMSPQRDQEYFCEGIAEELINALSQVEGLRVAARTSAFLFKGKAESIRKISEELDVDKVLEGSVRKAGNKLRVTVQLVNSADGYHIWSGKYDRDMEDIFAIQDEIAHSIVEKLKIKLIDDGKGPLVRRYTENIEAYSLYLQGRHYLGKRDGQSVRKGMEFLEQAILKDANYALAHAGLADCYSTLGIYTYLPPKVAFTKARAAAEKALEIDEMLAEAHLALGLVRCWFDRDWDGSEREMRRGVELNPSYAFGYLYLGYMMTSAGRHEDAIQEVKRAQALEPMSQVINMGVGYVLLAAGRFDDSIVELKKALELDPNHFAAHIFLGLAYLQNLMHEEARATMQKAIQLSQGNSLALTYSAYVFAMSGMKDQAREILAALEERAGREYVSAFAYLMVYVGLGNDEKVVEWLQRAEEDRVSPFHLYTLKWGIERLPQNLTLDALMRRIFEH